MLGLASLFIGCGQQCLREKGPLINGGEDYPDRELRDVQTLCLELLPGETLAWWFDASQRFQLGPARSNCTVVEIDAVLISTVIFSGTQIVEDSSRLFSDESTAGLGSREEGVELLLELTGINVTSHLSFSTLLEFLDEYATHSGLATSSLYSDATYLHLLEELLRLGLIDQTEYGRLRVSHESRGLDLGATIKSLGLLINFSELILNVNAGLLLQYIQRFSLDISFDEMELNALHLAFAAETNITLSELTSALNNRGLLQENHVTGMQSGLYGLGLVDDTNDQALDIRISDGAMLVLNKSASHSHVGYGGDLQYRIKIRNVGTEAATNVQVFDCLPRGLMLTGNDKNWRRSQLRVLPGSISDCLVWTIKKVDAGEELNLIFDIKVCN